MGGPLEQAVTQALAVEGAAKRFGAATVLDGVDLSVGSGELVTLLGPSGCGKTTLLRLIAGLATPDQGRVILAGADVTRTPPHRRSVGVVFQNYALFPHLDVGGNVGFGLTHKGLGKAALSARIGRALDLVQMGRFRDRPVSALSGVLQYIEESPDPTLAALSTLILLATLALLLIADRAVGLHRLAGLAE